MLNQSAVMQTWEDDGAGNAYTIVVHSVLSFLL